MGSSNQHEGPKSRGPEVTGATREQPTHDDVARVAKHLTPDALVEIARNNEGTALGVLTQAMRLDGQVRTRLHENLVWRGEFDALPFSIQQALQSDAVRQSALSTKGGITCSTTVRIAGGEEMLESILEAMYGPWNNWWGRCTVDNHTGSPATGSSFLLGPMAIKGNSLFHAQVGIAPPVRMSDNHYRLPMNLTKDLYGGTVYIDVLRVAGGWVVISHWENVQEATPFPTFVVGAAHSSVEAGNSFMQGQDPHAGYRGLPDHVASLAAGRKRGPPKQ